MSFNAGWERVASFYAPSHPYLLSMSLMIVAILSGVFIFAFGLIALFARNQVLVAIMCLIAVGAFSCFSIIGLIFVMFGQAHLSRPVPNNE